MPNEATPLRKRFHRAPTRLPTLQDVARAAGVSTATVSRCLNVPHAVGSETRRRVEEAIATLGYTPHGAARALASQRSRTIGAVVPTIDNAIFARCIQSLQTRLGADGYTLLLACSEYDPARERRQIEILLTRGVDGILMIGLSRDEACYDRLRQFGIPYVTTWVYAPEQEHPCIGFDNRRAAADIASYLIDLGHRDIAMIAGTTVGNDRAGQRVEGVRACLRQHGLTLPPERVIERPYNIAEGRSAMRQLLSSATRPTAVICGNDVLALGALFEATAAGVSVPEDLSITGFDDLELASQVQPSLTTMRVPSRLIGERAADWLLASLAKKPVERAISIDVDLVVRRSTGRARPSTHQ